MITVSIQTPSEDKTMMDPINLTELEFAVSGIFVKRESWPPGTVHDYMDHGRQDNLLHYIIDGSRTYQIDGHEKILRPGTLIFIPEGTKYRTETRRPTSGIGICFHMHSLDGTPILLERDVYTVENDTLLYQPLFSEMEQATEMYRSKLHQRALLLQILDNLMMSLDVRSAESVHLSPAITYLQKHYRENVPVAVYAAECHMSESYFRRLFSEYTGMTPLEYRDHLRFTEARFLLSCGMTVTKTAEQVGFCDASYLRRIYKKRTGHALHETGLPIIV